MMLFGSILSKLLKKDSRNDDINSSKILEDSAGNPIIDQFSKDGFIDCVLKIIDLTETDDSYKFHLKSSYDDNVLGMDVVVVKNIRSGFDNDTKIIKSNVYREGVIFKSSGEESNNLISTLAKLYDLKESSFEMVAKETFTAIALHQGCIDMLVEPVKIKLFGKDDDEESLDEEYYESFFNIDLKNGYVYWNEKDSDYRNPLIKALSK